MTKRTILIINEDHEISSALSNVLAELGYNDCIEMPYKRAMAWLSEGHSPSLMFVNLAYSGSAGLECLSHLRKSQPAIPVVVVASATQTRLVIEAAQLGASDYLIVPLDARQVQHAIGQTLEDKKRTEAPVTPTGLLPTSSSGNPEMTRACEIAKIVAPTDVPVLITGESGVGKEVFARFIHNHSERAAKPFIKVNCAALPHDLLESELFGYERGAFTGAMTDKPGKFELANGGTILLDEIGEMDPQLQAKLLHVLQDGEFSRLGGKKQLRTDARILATTNRPLEGAIARGEFREDLYFRLNVIRIKVPPLRERKHEIPALSHYFVQKYAPKYGRTTQELPPSVLRKLTEYRWPGNVRQLENVVRRYLILPELDIELADAPESRTTPSTPAEPRTPVAAGVQVQTVPPLSVSLPAEFSSLKEVGTLAAERAEREVVLWMLAQTEWNRKQAARRLNVCYKALLNKIKKWQISRPPSMPPRGSRRATAPVSQVVQTNDFGAVHEKVQD